jgi:hypothetical protein
MTPKPGKTVLDHLQEQGYTPEDDSPGRSLWADLTASGTGTVHVIVEPEDAWSVAVIFFDMFMACEWRAKFDPNVPDAVIIATIEAAEWQLADRRGGLVTPAQEATL